MFKTRRQGKQSDKDELRYKNLRAIVDKIFTDTKAEREKMNDNYERFAGKIWDDKRLEKYDSRAFINMEFSTIESIAPMLTDNPPIWTVVSHQPHMDRLAGVYNNALKYLWNVMDCQRKHLLVNLDAMIAKIGIWKTFWNPVSKKVETDLIDPREIFISPGYTDLWESPMCGMRSLKPMSWVKWRFPDLKELKIDHSNMDDIGSRMKFGDVEDSELHVRFARIYEIWLRDDKTEDDIVEEFEEKGQIKQRKVGSEKAYPYGKIIYLTDEQLLGIERQEAKHGKPPYIQFYDYERPHNFLGIAEGDQIEGLNKELNVQLQTLMGYVRKYTRFNYMKNVGAFGDTADLKERLLKGENIFDVDYQLGENSRPAIEVIKPPSLPGEVFSFFGMLMKTIEEISGVTDISKGAASKRERQSASEVAIQYEAAQTRTRQRIRNNEWSLKRAAYLWVHLMQQYYTEPHDFNFVEPSMGGRVYDKVDNTRQTAEATILSNMSETGQANPQGKLSAEDKQVYGDYMSLIQKFQEKDPVYFDFDIEIETNSTLPMDRQSQANLALRLFEQQAIDREALLKALRWPEADAVIQRMVEREMMKQGMAPQGMASQGMAPQGMPPGDLSDMQGAINE